MSGFNQMVSEFVDANILHPIVNFIIKEKGCQVTVEELRSVLQLQMPVPSPMKVSGLPQAGMIPVQPPTLNNFMAMSASNGKATTKKDKAPYNGPTCTYKFIRGKNKKGQICGEPAVEGSEFCRNCIKKKKASGGSGNADPDTPTGRVSGPGPGPVSGSRNYQNNNSEASGELTVVPYKNQPGYYKTVQHGFIVKQIEGNRIVATAVEENNKIRPLTEAEKRIAYDIGIGIVENEAPTVNVPMGSGLEGSASVEQQLPAAIPTSTSTIPVAASGIPNFPSAVPKMNPLMGQNITIPTIPKVQ